MGQTPKGPPMITFPALARNGHAISRSQALQVCGTVLSAGFAFALLRHLGGSGGEAVQLESALMVTHIATVLPAVPLGATVLALPKGDARHRRLGMVWAALMLATAAASAAIHGLRGEFHPIQPLAILTVYGVVRGVGQARSGDIASHQRIMSRVYLGLVLAGFFTFLPGRLFGQWLLG